MSNSRKPPVDNFDVPSEVSEETTQLRAKVAEQQEVISELINRVNDRQKYMDKLIATFHKVTVGDTNGQ